MSPGDHYPDLEGVGPNLRLGVHGGSLVWSGQVVQARMPGVDPATAPLARFQAAAPVAPEDVVTTLAGAARLLTVTLTIETPLSPGAGLALGTRAQPDLVLAPDTFPVDRAALVLDWPDVPLDAGTEIVLTLTGAPSSGSGRVRLNLEME